MAVYKRSLKAVIIYAIVGIGWIYFSDRIVLWVFGPLSAGRIEQIQTAKGMFFVIITSFLLYILIHQFYKSIYRSESAYLRMFKENPHPMWIYDRKSLRFLEVNESAIRKYKYTKEEFLKMTITDIRPKEELPRLFKSIPSFSSVFTESGIWKHVKKDGTVLYVNILSYALNYKGRSAKMISVLDITDRYIANQKLHEHKELLNAVINSTEDLIWAVDQEYNFISFNTAFCAFIKQLSGEDIKVGGHSIIDKYAFPFSDKIRMAYKNALAGERILLEQEIEIGEAGSIYGEITFNPIRYNKEIIGVAGFARNITDRKTNEIKLQKTLERYDILSHATNDAIWDWDLASGKMTWNPGMQHIFNYDTPGETKDWWEHNIHPEDRKMVITGINDLIGSDGNLWYCEYRFRSAAGSYKYVYARGYILYDKNGTALQMIGALQDIQQRKEYEEEIKKLSIVASRISNTVIITDNLGRIEWVNNSFIALTGYTLREALGKRPREFLNGLETDMQVLKRIDEKLTTRRPFSEEIINYHKSGTPYWVRMDVSPVLNEQKEVEYFVSIQTDISEKKRVIQRLEEQNVHLKEIARISSHEIRKPVSSILGIIGLIDKENLANPENRELINYLDSVTRDLDQMIVKIVRKCNEIYL